MLSVAWLHSVLKEIGDIQGILKESKDCACAGYWFCCDPGSQ